MATEDDINAAIQRLMGFDKQVTLQNGVKMANACGVVVRVAKRETPVDLGQLRAATDFKVVVDETGVHGVIYNPVEYAPFVHQGTGIYNVDGTGRKTPWVWKGESAKWEGWHVTVGQQPRPFMKNAAEQTRSDVEAIFGAKG